MEDLIEALTIFLKYGDPYNPTHCEHDEMFVCINPNIVSDEDKGKLMLLSFSPREEVQGFVSFRFGSC